MVPTQAQKLQLAQNLGISELIILTRHDCLEAVRHLPRADVLLTAVLKQDCLLSKHLHFGPLFTIEIDPFLTWLHTTLSLLSLISCLLCDFGHVVLKTAPSDHSFRLSVPRTQTIGRLLSLLSKLQIEFQAAETSLEQIFQQVASVGSRTRSYEFRMEAERIVWTDGASEFRQIGTTAFNEVERSHLPRLDLNID